MESHKTIVEQARKFEKKLEVIKSVESEFKWYPYSSMSNVVHLAHILPTDFFAPIGATDQPFNVLDVGAADGDVGYFFEFLGCRVDFLENQATNFNDCKGLTVLGEKLSSDAKVLIQDLDYFADLSKNYDLAIALGILYHLRNPMSFLITLALSAEKLVLSTRVARVTPDGQDISKLPVAYLLKCREANDDPTNFWIFSPFGLERTLERCGWRIVDSYNVGDLAHSNPVDSDHDERMFVYCERVENYKDLRLHSDF